MLEPNPTPASETPLDARSLHLAILLAGAAFFYVVGSPLLWINGTTGVGPWLEEIDVLAIVLADAVTLAAIAAYVRRRWWARRSSSVSLQQ